MIHIVLCQPEIPQNTGNIMRTSVGSGCKLHLIEPMGFKIDDKKLRRSAVDYYDSIHFDIHKDWESFTNSNKGKYFYITRYGTHKYTEPKYNDIVEDVYLVFGSESYGIDRMLLANNEDSTLRIPTNDKIRSLNLSNSVSIVIYEVLRQLGFPDLSSFEPDKYKGANYLKTIKDNDINGK